MISGKSKRRLVFVEADNIASDFKLLSGKVPDFIQETGLEGVVPPQQINERIQALRRLSVDDYIRQTVLPSEYPKRKNAPEVIRALGGDIIREVHDGPLYLAEVTFTHRERSRRILVLAQNRKSRNGVWMPKHHRKATELLRFYAPYSLPVITFIDTPGADAGEEANRQNQAHTISELIAEMAGLTVPTVGIVFGNGYSGGAIPLAATNVLLSVRDGVFNTIHPTGLSEIAYNYNLSWQECAKYIGVSAYELCQGGYLDAIIDYSPVEADAPRAVVGAIFSALDGLEANATAFLRDADNHYFFQYYRDSVLRYLHPHGGSGGNGNGAAGEAPTRNLTVFGAFYRFHRYLKMRRRMTSRSLLRYSRIDIQNLPTGELQDRIERERIGRFNKWVESPLEVRYDDPLSKRYKRYLDTFSARGEERTRFASFFMGRPEDNFKKATQELALELGLHLYNYWKVEASENLAQLLQYLEGAQEAPPKDVSEATLLDVLKQGAVREQFSRTVRNLILFDLLYDKLVENLPLIARELKDTNVITEQSMADLLNKVFKDASVTFNKIFPTIGTKEGNEDFFYWLESLISRMDVDKLMRQVSEWKRLAFPRLSEPLFGVLTYYFSNLLPSFYAALRGEKRFDGKINPRQIGIKDFWNRLNQAYRDLLLQNLLTEYKLSSAITPQHVLNAYFSRFEEINSDLMTSDPVHFPGFRQSVERALEQHIPPVGVLTGFADFKYGDVSSRVGLVISNTRFQAGAFDMASGEKVCKLMAECAVNQLPVIMFISSGGMQTKEGAGSLFSMSVLNDRITRFVEDFDLPVICFGFRDCTGGAQASFVTHPLARTYYLSGAVIPFAGQRVVPSHLPAESILANYLSANDGTMDGLVANPFDEDLDSKLREIDPAIPVPTESVPEAIARILKGELHREEVPAREEESLPKGFISFRPVKRMLIHARGCTAARLIQGAQAADVEVVLVQSDADMESYPTKLLRNTDRLVSLGGNTPQESYLNGMSVIRIAEMEAVDAIHPGIGFLSENPDFALLCRKHGYNFIGPRAHSMEMMGNKSNAIATARRLKVPTVPGSHGVLTDPTYANSVAQEIGFPVLIKATFGGGGKGMRIVHDPARFKEEFVRTGQEAFAAFGNGDVYLEKFVESMRHVEVQVLRDSKGNTRILGLRDCSVQRDNQKLIEESGSTHLPETLRASVFKFGELIADDIDYIGAGTIEFIFDRTNQCVYFMEMNTRLQVEHPVTEMVTGVDIVEEQIRIASGKSIDQIEVGPKGYAMEVRINAEKMAVSPEGKVTFTPSPGVVTKLYLPPHPDIRIVSAVQEGSTIPPYYDSLCVQIIAHGEDRKSVIETLRAYLARIEIEGVYTNVALMEAILTDPVFQGGDYDTKFLLGFYQRTPLQQVVERMEARNQFTGKAIDLDAIRIENSDELKVLSPRTGVFYASPTPDDPPFVEVGSVFDAGSPICLMEAMKVFEQLTLADYNKLNGVKLFPEESRFTVTRVLAESGQTVNQGDLLFIVKPVPQDMPLTVAVRAS